MNWVQSFIYILSVFNCLRFQSQFSYKIKFASTKRRVWIELRLARQLIFAFWSLNSFYFWVTYLNWLFAMKVVKCQFFNNKTNKLLCKLLCTQVCNYSSSSILINCFRFLITTWNFYLKINVKHDTIQVEHEYNWTNWIFIAK